MIEILEMEVPNAPEYRQCRECREVKPITEYHKHKYSKSGRNTRCKACVSKYGSKRARIHKEEIREKRRVRALNDIYERLSGNALGEVKSKYCLEVDKKINRISSKELGNKNYYRCCGEIILKGTPCPVCGLTPKYTCQHCGTASQSPLRSDCCPERRDRRARVEASREIYKPKVDGTLVCSKCKTERPAVEFKVDKHLRTGRRSICRECDAKYLREWRKKLLVKKTA